MELYPRLSGVYETTEKWLRDFFKDEHLILEHCQKLNMEPTTFHQQPKTIEKKVHWKFNQPSKPPSAFVVRMDKGRILSYNGAIVSPDNHLIWDLSIEFWADFPQNHFLLQKSSLPPLQSTDKKIAALTFCASQYYYHWLFDVLPRLYLLRYMGIDMDQYAINWNGKPAFQTETLDLLGIDQSKIIMVTENTNLQAEKLYIPSLPGYTGHMGKWTVDYLRNELMIQALKKSRSGSMPKRIYICRGKAQSRKVTNEPELISLLKKYDITPVYLEKMTVADQVRLFHEAEVIIGPHGGGLTNLAFCSPKTKVLEIFSPYYVHTCYWILSQHVKADYHYLIGIGERPPEYTDPNAVHREIEVDLQDVKKMLKLMNIKKPS
ncbi:glycosyltransferase family 61 protein [Bacillus sp. USDA818B3_A]|uniref:glycosyltransferase family 61 protein n=1 Tax=Bacillus sp. USDA818B3_A TaxID=2698834 RepID=UPI00136CB0C5|nr:glycosyltransferase family 61 protein [Bacillus sp. USDA818B3_A]